MAYVIVIAASASAYPGTPVRDSRFTIHLWSDRGNHSHPTRTVPVTSYFPPSTAPPVLYLPTYFTRALVAGDGNMTAVLGASRVCFSCRYSGIHICHTRGEPLPPPPARYWSFLFLPQHRTVSTHSLRSRPGGGGGWQ